jgi:concanavalin A-like lectin/glucanase superfamily protein
VRVADRGAALGLLLALGCGLAWACGACGYPSVDGDALPRSPPARSLAEDAGSGDGATPLPEPSPADGGGGDADAGAPSKTCASPDLVLCLTFEGAVVDQSPAPLTPAELQNVGFVGGKEGQAGSFNATSAIRFAPNAAFDLPGSGTIEAWVKRSAEPNPSAVVFDDDMRLSLTIAENGTVLCKSSGGAVQGTTPVPVEQWAHVACVVGNGTMHAYLNGSVDASGAGAVASSPAAGAAAGGNSPSGEPFLGAIDSLRVFRVARSTNEIVAAAKP